MLFLLTQQMGSYDISLTKVKNTIITSKYPTYTVTYLITTIVTGNV
jgi:hypothetical protein